jgi:hypothetical protein
MLNLIEVTDAVVIRLLKNTTALQEFPFLSNFADLYAKSRVTPEGKYCAPCMQAKRRKQLGLNFNDVKRTLAAMSDEKKAALKRVLNAKAIRIRYLGANGKKITGTFA